MLQKTWIKQPHSYGLLLQCLYLKLKRFICVDFKWMDRNLLCFFKTKVLFEM